jgi:hypothetical protein
MRIELGAVDPEQLCALQNIFNQAWLRANSSIDVNAAIDWQALRTEIAQRVLDYAQTGLPDDEIIRAILTSLGIS